MHIKKLFGVLFIILMLLSVPCVYATDGSSENTNVNKNIGNINSVAKEAIQIGSDIIKVSTEITKCTSRQPTTLRSPDVLKGELKRIMVKFIVIEPQPRIIEAQPIHSEGRTVLPKVEL